MVDLLLVHEIHSFVLRESKRDNASVTHYQDREIWVSRHHLQSKTLGFRGGNEKLDHSPIVWQQNLPIDPEQPRVPD